MQIAYSSYSLLPLLAFFIAVLLLGYGWKFRSMGLGKTFFILIAGLAWWSLSTTMEYLSPDLAEKMFWMKMTYFGIVTIPVGWLAFNLKYVDKPRFLKTQYFLVLTILPLITLIMVWTNDIHHLMWKEIWLDTTLSFPVDAVTHGLWFWIFAVYSYSLILAGVICLIISFQRSSGMYRKQSGILLLATFAPWLGNFLYLVGIKPFDIIDPTPLSFAITGIAFYWGMSRLHLLEVTPIAYEAVLGSMIDGVIIIDIRYRIIELNNAAQNIIGCRKTEVIGRLYSEVLPGQIGQIDLTPDIGGTQAILAFGIGEKLRYYRIGISVIGSQDHNNGFMILLHDDTERIVAEVSSRERVAIEAELNERKRAEEEIRLRLELEEAIARISSRFVGLFDVRQAIDDSLSDLGRLCNAPVASLFVISENEVVPSNQWCLKNPQPDGEIGVSLDIFPFWMEKLKNRIAVNIFEVSDLADEAEKRILSEKRIRSVFAIPLFVSSLMSGCIVICSDDTIDWNDNYTRALQVASEIIGNALERKKVSDELERVNAKLRSMNSLLETKVEQRTQQLAEAVVTAQASNQAKSEFLASMSHELRTPLNAIIGFSQVLEERYFGDLNEKQAEYVSDIVGSGKHLLSLINDILDLSKIEAGKMELDMTKVRIGDIVRGSMVMVKEKALAHGIALDLQIAEDIGDLEITGDERRLKQVMFNLLSNATKFTPDGGIVRVEANKNENECVISITDNGIGMTTREQQRLFEAFYQASGGIKDKTPGTGLGLAITKNIVQKHGGKIWVKSEGPNKGSSFTFTLPIMAS